ncbi:hypothetical protein WDW86_06445, partial [Bdellovibrionota bacterium FG-2]
GQDSVALSILNTLKGDLRLRLGSKSIPAEISGVTREALIQYAVTRRRVLYLEQFRKVMGYWHTFHMPFAVFMYLVGAIHIATALLLHV